MLYPQPLPKPQPLREAIIRAYRMDENICLAMLLKQATLPQAALTRIAATAQQLVVETRAHRKKLGRLDNFLHQYDLSSEEGIALMCLAEALLRIPDKQTMDKLIGDKLSNADWANHLSTSNGLFVNAATWSLLFTGKIFASTIDNQESLLRSLQKLLSRCGMTVIRPIILQGMKIIGKQFVLGETITSALDRSRELEARGYRFSYDMLGEAARTAQDAEHYFHSYQQAITAIAANAKPGDIPASPSISIKLSALHPRYEFSQRRRVFEELVPKLLLLAEQAKSSQIGLTIDAEEADRLDISLDIFEILYTHPKLTNWEGLGLAVQAYQKRAPFVLDWLIALAKKHGKRMMVRLVKGAYWDFEIKLSQLQGMENYPVYTRKNSTDVAYLACAKKMLAQRDILYPQFGTHNAYCVAAIMEMAGDQQGFEFQCLHGMGRSLYDQVIAKDGFNIPCRIYAPVGTHKDLLGYLVRRLLENGANTSFINQLAEENIPIEKIIADPVARIANLPNKPHPGIPLPRDIYQKWQNSKSIDLTNLDQLSELKKVMDAEEKELWQATSIIAGKKLASKDIQERFSPSDSNRLIGHACKAQAEDVENSIASAFAAQPAWENTPVDQRARILERAAELFEQHLPQLMTLLSNEGGKCIPDCLSEVRETIDYCRYYAYRARQDLPPQSLPGPTGESNQLSLHPRGVIACISPWNFPLAIFTGQITAALAAGNAVIAKPAEQTPFIAQHAISILHEAGIPRAALQLLLGRGSVIGNKLIADPRIAGVMLTGSTETAQIINQTLAQRKGPIVPFIAETGGQNAMIVDSSALLEQVVIDIVQSAFNSAGQRCSALRVLFVQDDIADALLTMLKGYMSELVVSDPRLLATDIGPIIDQSALAGLQQHFNRMSKEAKLIYQIPLRNTTPGHYFAPCVFELKDLSLLKQEIFGPILHVIRYSATDLDKVIASIKQTGYGLTGGIHSRIDATINYVTSQLPVGNIYVNRNMIGAVVGVQPFGGERLSGTGPKAGGPHYLPRLCVERSTSINTTATGGNARLISLHEDD